MVWVCPIIGSLLIYEQSLIASLSAIGAIYVTFISTGLTQIKSRATKIKATRVLQNIIWGYLFFWNSTAVLVYIAAISQALIAI